MSAYIRYSPTALGGGGGGGSSSLTMGTFDGQIAAAEGATITLNQLFLQSADAIYPGLVNVSTQTWAGVKTFNSNPIMNALTASQLVVTNGSKALASQAIGNLTAAGTDGIAVTGGSSSVIGSGTSLAQHVADSTHNGYLSSTDWVAFNAKQPAGNYITALTGDGTAAGPGSVALTLATVNGNVGSFTPAAITVNAKGLVTAASNVPTGNLTAAGTDGIVVTSGTGAVLGSGTSLAQHVASASFNGYLSSTDWSTFNNKQATISIGAFDTTPNSAGLSLSGAAISLAAANGTNPGALTASAQAVGGVKTFASAPVMSALTASQAVFTDGSKALISNAITGTGNVVMSASPTLTGTITAAAITASGAINLAVLTASQAVVTDGSKNLASLAYTSAATASTLMQRDSSANTRANSLIEGFTTTATAAGTTTLTVVSTKTQQFTGVTTQTVVLPDATTLVAGQQFNIANRSTGTVTVNANGGGLIQTLVGGSQVILTVVTVATAAGTWDSQYTVAGLVAAVNPTVQKFTSGTAQTYTTPAGVQYIRVRMSGGGGGGGGSGTTAGTAATNGGNTTFGSSLLTAPGGSLGARGAAGGTGGTAPTVNSPAIDSGSRTGDDGGPATTETVTTVGLAGGQGGTSGGGGGGTTGGYGGGTNNGGTAATNSGGGGGGASEGGVINGTSGSGGGGGAFVDSIINGPAATYSYTVGGGGTGQTAGTTGAAGGNGAAGYIEVTEYYTNFSVGTTVTVAANTVLAGPASGATAAPTFRTLAPADLNTAIVNGTSITVTPSAGFGTVTLASANCAIIGKQAHIWGYFKVGTLAASTLSLGITGATIDSAQLTTQVQAQYLGVAYYIQNSGTPASISAPAVIFYDGSTTNAVFLGRTQASNGFQKNTGSGTFLTAADSISYDFWIPIT